MDKNIVAFLRDDLRTVSVDFGGNSSRSYTYLTDRTDLNFGDLVVVPVGADDERNAKLAYVVAVHDGVNIEPNTDIKFKYIIDRVDFTSWNKNMEQEAQISETLRAAHVNNVRRQYASQVLAELDPATAGAIKALLVSKKEGE